MSIKLSTTRRINERRLVVCCLNKCCNVILMSSQKCVRVLSTNRRRCLALYNGSLILTFLLLRQKDHNTSIQENYLQKTNVIILRRTPCFHYMCSISFIFQFLSTLNIVIRNCRYKVPQAIILFYCKQRNLFKFSEQNYNAIDDILITCH